jgi:hypothetical protein
MAENMIGTGMFNVGDNMMVKKRLENKETAAAEPKDELSSVPDDKMKKQMEALGKMANNLKAKSSPEDVDIICCGEMTDL